MVKAVQIIDPYRSPLRGPSRTSFHVSVKYESISRFFVETVVSEHNQDISFLLVGNKGRGKSFAGLSIGYHCGLRLAEALGGKVGDYFDVDTTVATIDEDSARELMFDETPHRVKIYDDIGIGWGARDWRDRENIEKGEIFQINRIDSQIQIFTIPHQFLLDKIPRSLVSHFGIMDKRWFGKGYTSLRLFQPETLFKENIIINPYLQADRQKYIMHIIPKPPDHIMVRYKELRRRMKELAVKKRREGKTEPERKPVEHPMKALQQRNFVEIKKLYAPYVAEIKSEERKVGFRKAILNVTRNHKIMDVTRARRYLETLVFEELVH